MRSFGDGGVLVFDLYFCGGGEVLGWCGVHGSS